MLLILIDLDVDIVNDELSSATSQTITKTSGEFKRIGLRLVDVVYVDIDIAAVPRGSVFMRRRAGRVKRLVGR